MPSHEASRPSKNLPQRPPTVSEIKQISQQAKASLDPLLSPGAVSGRAVILRVDLEIPAPGRVGALEVRGVDGHLSDSDAARVRTLTYNREQVWAADSQSFTQYFPNDYEAFAAFVEQVHGQTSEDTGVDLRIFLLHLLLSDETVVPQFGSPPSAWFPLRAIAEQSSAIGVTVAWGMSGKGVSLVGAYLGGLFLVKFVTPIVSEAGKATAAGVAAKIRAAFRIDETQSIGELLGSGDRGALPAGSTSDSGDDESEASQ
jgi:hypothetical protein